MATVSESLFEYADETFRACLNSYEPELFGARLEFVDKDITAYNPTGRPAWQQSLFDVGYSTDMSDGVWIKDHRVRSAMLFRTISVGLPLITTHGDADEPGQDQAIVNQNPAFARLGLKRERQYVGGTEQYVYVGEPSLRESTPRNLINATDASKGLSNRVSRQYHLRIFSDTRPRQNSPYVPEWTGTAGCSGLEWINNIIIRPSSSTEKALTFYDLKVKRKESRAIQVSLYDARRIGLILRTFMNTVDSPDA